MSERWGPHWAAEAAGQMQLTDKVLACPTIGCRHNREVVVGHVMRCPVCSARLVEVEPRQQHGQ